MNVAAAATPSVFEYVVDWQTMLPADADAIRAFWHNERALTDETQISERLQQVVMHARTAQGEIAGVCTAVNATPPQLGQPFYFWRTFIGVRWRSTPLVMSLLKRSCALLEDYAIAQGYPCIGVLLELENTRFRNKGRMAVWSNPHFAYIGRSQRGLDLRAHYFKGAKLT